MSARASQASCGGSARFAARIAVVLALGLGAVAMLPTQSAQSQRPAPGEVGTPAASARAALLAEDFAAARKSLAAIGDPAIRITLSDAADECELDAVCDAAQRALESSDFAGTIDLLAPATKRLPGARAALPRARCLHAIASIRLDELTGETAQFLAQLRTAVAAGDVAADKLTKLRQDALDKIEKGLVDAATLARTAETSGALYQTSTTLSALDGLKQKAPLLAAMVTALETKLETKDWTALDDRVRSFMTTTTSRAFLAAATMQYYQRNFDATRKLLDEGLARDPLNRQMLSLRAKIDDWEARRGG